MAGKIKILPDTVAQTIAAGEVVERPASVVKELVENAIDARSTEIIVGLEAGGLQMIRVQDNGEGMEGEDVPVALQRYATSKIRAAEDLFNLHTLGFRGEALPSIASISHMTITTRVSHAVGGVKVVCEGGEIKSLSEIGCPVGTEVEVKNLFYNIPVKRKFLKSIRSELRTVLSHFLKLSLSHPLITFKLIHDGRLLHEFLRTDSLEARVEAIVGNETYEHLQKFEWEEGDTRIRGFASLPSLSKGNGDGIHMDVNGRFIRDRIIYKAITDAYRHVIPAGKFPVVILSLALPPDAVDVNVHPTKAEVKFRSPEKIFTCVHRALSALHEPKMSAPEAVVPKELEPGVPSLLPIFSRASRPYETSAEEGVMVFPGVQEASSPDWESEGAHPLRVIGQVLGTFLLCEAESGLVIIDQHAAHERILFEKYRNHTRTGSFQVIRFLIPHLMELSPEASFILESSLEEFRSLGFEIDPAGEQTYALRSVPSMIDPKDPATIVKEMIEELSSLRRGTAGSERIEAMLVTLACHSAVRAHYGLRKEEMEELVASLAPYSPSTTCPHGRPIFFHLRREDLNRQFKRNR